MQVVLVTFKADGERRSFTLPRDVTVIGRREDSDLRIPLGEVSRKHCRFIVEGESLRLEDLGSSNGTFHNGTRVQEATVQAGDVVQVGPVVFMIQINGVPADSEIQPSAPAANAANQDTSVATEEVPPAAEGEAPHPASESQVIDLDNFVATEDSDSGAPSIPMDLDFIAEEPGQNPTTP